MKQKILFAGVVVLTGITGCASFQGSGNFLGDPATPAAASRTIVISPDENYVNVTDGEVINFVAGNQSFAWNFDAANNVTSFALNKVAPANVLDHNVEVYITHVPRYDAMYIGGP